MTLQPAVCALQEGLRCLHTVHTDPSCATPTLTNGVVPQFTYYNYTVDHRWIADRAPSEEGWRFSAGRGAHGCHG